MKKLLRVIIGASTALLLFAIWSLAIWALGLENYQASDNLIFLGRLHPLVLHLPIGFMVLALLLDIGHILPTALRQRLPSSTVLHGLIVLSATSAVVHGILLYISGGYEGSELANRHLIGGCAFLTAAALTLLFKLWAPTGQRTRILTAGLSLLAMAVLMVSAHDGASLTHGESYLSQYAPDSLKPILEPGYAPPTEEPTPATSILDTNVYESAIQPIFDRVCIQCHKESKSKGKLRMDSYAELIKGGESGDAYEPHDVDRSYLIERMLLPLDDDERMPPEGKPQHTDQELAILQWWIKIGAPADGSLRSHNPPTDLIPVIEGFGQE